MTSAATASCHFGVFGTSATLLVTPAGVMAEARALVEGELAAIDLACNRFRPDSEISLLNGSRGADVAVSDLFAEAIDVALRAARCTDSDVDPTCGAALVRLGYDRDFALITETAPVHNLRAAHKVIHRTHFVPPKPLDNLARSPVGQRPQGRAGHTREPVNPRPGPGSAWGLPSGSAPGPGPGSAPKLAAWQRIWCDRARAVVRMPPGVQLDLGATAKAWAADRCARLVGERFGCGILISLGGDIAVAEPAPAGGWRVRVTDDHAAGPEAPGQTVAISSGGLATSSVAVRRWRHGDEMVHHIVNPATGRPARSCWRTVSVAAATCVDANAAATASIIRGDAAPAWLSSLGLPARLVHHDGSVTLTAGWPRGTISPEVA